MPIVPPTEAGSRVASLYSASTRNRGTRRRNTGSPVETLPSGYTGLRGTLAA